ncbi:gamma-glutamyltransferase family protein [Roseibacterium beibuensis]|uniref:gamma-glutamyltransferase family protein n=1 Tax=[Roseibacterium] beibuensis TaxID=1193142 RepID=UPI00217F1CA4|nr:gamma-glutamyltransferase family protein [Roseibacterium beibuensis]MCS6627061.1 gamma-glutamyltransferase family protein [Roseibacterium beibuensis]
MRQITSRPRLLAILAAAVTAIPGFCLAQTVEAERPRQAMVAAANPMAAEAGLAVLKRGGSAIDAAVAVQVMLGLVEPQSSGIGGGAFIMHFDAATGEVDAYNGRETAPAGAMPDMFLDAAGRPLPRNEAMLSGRATGAPGAMAVMALAHQTHGRLPWSSLFDETIVIAEDGFDVTPRLAEHIHETFPQASAPDVRTYFSRADGSPMQIGDRVINRAYAGVLRRLAAEGPGALQSGPIAEAIVRRTGAAPLGGTLTLEDLAAYRPQAVEPVCGPYRVYIICVPPPPSSGAALLQLMALLDRTDTAERGPDDPIAWVQFAEASRLMYADRDRYFGDPDYVSVPVAGLLDADYLDDRARQVGRRAASRAPSHGTPEGVVAPGPDATAEPGGTTHFVVVDFEGNVASVTSTVESYFGSGRMVEGFFLNNQMTDFSFRPTDADGAPAANVVAGGKRPRSSMSPVIVLDREGRLVAALGSPGGNAILAYNGKALLGLLGWELPLLEAFALPNLLARGENFNGEAARFPAALREEMDRRGVTVRPGSGEASGLHGVVVGPDGLTGAADPRREGMAIVLEAVQ